MKKMNYRVVLCIVLPIMTMVYGISVNFQVFLSGSPATFKNFIVTIVCLVIWILCIVISFKAESKAVMKFYSIIWILTLGLAGLTAYINFLDTTINVGWAIPFAILFLTQWIGLNFLFDSYLLTSIITIFISLMMFIAIISIMKRWMKVA